MIALQKSWLLGLHVSLRFSGSKFFINLRRQFRVRKIISQHQPHTQVFPRFPFFLCM